MRISIRSLCRGVCLTLTRYPAEPAAYNSVACCPLLLCAIGNITAAPGRYQCCFNMKAETTASVAEGTAMIVEISVFRQCCCMMRWA